MRLAPGVILLLAAVVLTPTALKAISVNAIPRFTLIRQNHLTGIEKITLQCSTSETPKEEPDCFVTQSNNSLELMKKIIEPRTARNLVETFMKSVPVGRIKKLLEPSHYEPKISKRGLLSWYAGVGKTEAHGEVRLDRGTEELRESLLLIEVALRAEALQ